MDISPDDLAAAQEKLLARQAESRARRLAAGLPVGIENREWRLGRGPTVIGRSESPGSGGDGEVAGDKRREAIERIERLRRRHGVKVKATPQVGVEVVAGLMAELQAAARAASAAEAAAGGQGMLSLAEGEVKLYPDMGMAACQAGEAAIYRVWLLCGYLDKMRQGWVKMENVRGLAEGGAAVRLPYRWRRLRQILNQGEERFWRRDRKNGRLWLFSATRAAAALGLERLGGWPVLLPVKVVVSKFFKAHLYAAWHSGRKNDNPISREKQKEVTGIPVRTQRHYCRVAGIERQRNLAIGEPFSKAHLEELSWKRGPSTFVFTDKKGRRGPPNGRYLAWELPSTHKAGYSRARKGRQRKINRKLKDLVNKRARGNSNEPVDRLFHPNGAAAGKAYNRRPDVDAYWKTDKTGGDTCLWQCLAAQECWR